MNCTGIDFTVNDFVFIAKKLADVIPPEYANKCSVVCRCALNHYAVMYA